jgi:hypothetical protein
MRGFRYAELSPELVERISQWIEIGEIAEGVEIIPGRAYRWKDHFVKLFRPRGFLHDMLRTPPAIRSAELSRRIDPVITPRPLVALGGRRRPGALAGLLVTEFIEGEYLPTLWSENPTAVEAFPRFLALIARQGIVLGDFHLFNAIWDGAHWILLDLDGIRHRLHGVNQRKLIERQWARTWLGIQRDPALRPCFERFLTEAGLDWNPTVAWERVERHARQWGGGRLYRETGEGP